MLCFAFASQKVVSELRVEGAENEGEDPLRKPQQQKQWWLEVDLSKEGKIRKIQAVLSQKTISVRKNIGFV
jgi:hypothetical protein